MQQGTLPCIHGIYTVIFTTITTYKESEYQVNAQKSGCHGNLLEPGEYLNRGNNLFEI